MEFGTSALNLSSHWLVE